MRSLEALVDGHISLSLSLSLSALHEKDFGVGLPTTMPLRSADRRLCTALIPLQVEIREC